MCGNSLKLSVLWSDSVEKPSMACVIGPVASVYRDFQIGVVKQSLLTQ